MSRPRLEVADIIRSAGTDFIERNRHWLRWTHLKVLLAIARCRTAALGGHIGECACFRPPAPLSSVSLPPADSPAITPAGFDPIRASSSPSLYCGARFVASSSPA